MKKFLGLDFGLQKIGVAIGDDQIKIAFARPPILDAQDAITSVTRLCDQEEIDELVIGLPQSTDGSASEQTVIAQTFIAQLETGHRPVRTIDERFSTQGIQRQQEHRNLERGQEDSLVAQALLQSFFDSI